MTKMSIYPYKIYSKSAKLLATHMQVKRIKHENSRYIPSGNHVIINWGSSSPRDFAPARTLNSNILPALCKLASFKALRGAGVPIPDFWEDSTEIPDNAFPVVCRAILNGHSGAGITIANSREELVLAPLYTKYVKKKHEYRVHVVCGQVIYIQRKARKLEVENPNWQVQNLAGGFVYVEAIELATPTCVLDIALKCIEALGLDFGAVDIIWNEHQQQAYALEVNTACGLEERTAEKYSFAFKSMY